jgi:hypothetical protein
MDFPSMGITMSAAQFNGFAAFSPHFRAVLRQWGIDSDEPLGRLIVAATPAQLMDVVAAHPLTDFFLPDRYRVAAGTARDAGHEEADAPAGYFLLRARQAMPRANPPAWSCGL